MHFLSFWRKTYQRLPSYFVCSSSSLNVGSIRSRFLGFWGSTSGNLISYFRASFLLWLGPKGGGLSPVCSPPPPPAPLIIILLIFHNALICLYLLFFSRSLYFPAGVPGALSAIQFRSSYPGSPAGHRNETGSKSSTSMDTGMVPWRKGI